MAIKQLLLFVSSFIILVSCGSPKCGYRTLKCTSISDKAMMTDEERLNASDLYYLLTFNSYEDKTHIYGCDHYYTKYNVTIDKKIKGEIDIKDVFLLADFNSCVFDAERKQENVEIGRKYYVYLKWYEPVNGYETTEKQYSIQEYIGEN